MSTKVFISFKKLALDGSGNDTPDVAMAREIYNDLTREGIDTYFSEESSQCNYFNDIAVALDEAQIMIVIATRPEHLTSTWVQHEWGSFMSTIINGKRPERQLYLYLSGMGCQQLPTMLCNFESFFPSTKKKLLSSVKSNLNVSLSQRIHTGDTFKLGSYPQGENGDMKPIVWRVVDLYRDRALLVTDKLIDAIPFNRMRTSVTWEDSTVRQWLNNEFIAAAFSAGEQGRLLSATHDGCEDTVFLLSISEVKNYFRYQESRIAAVTEFAKSRGCYISAQQKLGRGESAGWWWLRSPGYYDDFAAYVKNSGAIDDTGYCVDDERVSIRPAVWIKA